MFAYSDPAGRNYLGNATVAAAYRTALDNLYDATASHPDCAFTWLEAMEQLAGGKSPGETEVEWKAFPISESGTDDQIDAARLTKLDEYVEWHAEKSGGSLRRVTFTTEFREYFAAIAGAGANEIMTVIKDVFPGSNPTLSEIFGAGATAANLAQIGEIGRRNRFLNNLQSNPWNNGQKGILCLTLGPNSADALFKLLLDCGIERTQGTPQQTCSMVSCEEARASDPQICALAQSAARDNDAFTLKDPAGIRIVRLDGNWSLNGNPIDINDSAQHGNIWRIERNGRRGVLNVVPGLALNNAVPATGSAVAKVLAVDAKLLTARESDLPEWAQTGLEGLGGRPG